MKKLLLIFILFFGLSSRYEASHIVSADLTYECVGGLTYKLTLKLYRDCGGLGLGPFEVVNYKSDSCSRNANLIMLLDTSYEVSQVCDSLIPFTRCHSGGYLPGIEVYVYTTTVTLSGYCPDWKFTYDECCRSTSINNLSPGYRFYTQTTLNNKGGKCNDSPVFNAIPILYSCSNEPINYNNIPFDVEGDSLSFKMINTKSSATLNIPYSNIAYTSQNPFPTVSGITFDSVTGQMSFSSSSLQQVIATILITEYDSNGNIKGTHLRDIEFIIINCPPPKFNPYTSGVNFDTTNYYYKGCYNTPFCFDVFSVSYDTANPMVLNYYGNIPRSTFTTTVSNDTTYGKFCWTPDSNDLGNFHFQIEAIAKTCPLKRKNIFNYFINIDTVFNSCVDTNLYLTTTGFIVIDSSYVFDNSASGFCPVQSVHISKDTFTCDDVGVNSVTVTTTYQNGTVKVCNSTVTVHDTISPIAACLDTTVYLNSSGVVNIDSSFVHDYSIVSCGTATITLSRYSFFCSDLGPNTVRLILTEDNGMKDTCYGIVTVVDTFLPNAITFDTTVYLNNAGLKVIDSSYVDNGSYDNCVIVKRYLSKDTFDCGDVGIDTIWFFVEDFYGFKDSAKAAITVLDTNKPQVFCQDTSVYLIAGSVSITPNYIKSSSYVTCGSLRDSISRSTFFCSDTGINFVTLYVIDSMGNIDSCVANVNVIDTTTAGFHCKDTTVYLDVNGMVVIDSSYTLDSINQVSCNFQGFRLEKDTFYCSDIGVNSVKMFVNSSNGKTDSCTAIVTVLDTISPNAICTDTTIYLSNTGTFTIDSNYINGGSFDNCDIATVSLSKTVFNCSDTGVNSVVMTVTDVNGNIDVCSAIVTVLDTIAPSIFCKDTTIYLDATGISNIDSSFVLDSVADFCGLSRVYTNDTSFTCSNIGLNTVSLIAIDLNGNTDSCSAIVTVIDTTSPTAICQNITVYLDATGQVTIDSSMIDNGSTDNCSIVSMTLSQTNFDCNSIGVNSVTLTVTDGSGNSNNCSATVNVLDTVNPTPTCTDTTIYLSTSGLATITNSYVENGSTDNCGIDSIWLSKYTFDCYDFGNDTIQLYARDSSGNVDSCSAIIHIMDTVNPIAICKDTTVYLGSSGMFIIDSSYINNNSQYGCDILSIVLSQDTFGCPELGNNSITMVVTDQNLNTDSCNAIVTVLDTTSPTAICQNITVYLDATGQVTIDSSMIDNGSTDNCSIVSMTLSQTNFDCNSIGVNTVTLTVTDGSGNSDNCSAIVNVIDTVSPIPSCKDTTIYLSTSGLATITNSYVENGSTDNCGIDSIWLSKYTFDCYDFGNDTIQLYARDSSGNVDSCSAIIHIMDTVNPIAICKDTTVYLGSSGMFIIDSSYINNNPMYGCDILSIVLSEDTFDCSNIGANVISMVVSDRNNNMDSCSAIVTVLDTTSPKAICQNITVYLDATGQVTIDSSMIDNGSTDNCSIVSMTLSQTNFDCNSIGVNTVTLTVADASGNIDSCTSSVNVLDTLKPIANCTDTTIYLNALGNFVIDSTYIDNGSIDNCGIKSIRISKDSFSCSDIGANLVILTVTDLNGNTDTCSSLVTVIDTVMPVSNAGMDTNICGYLSMNLNAQPILPHQTATWSNALSSSLTFIGNVNNPKTSISGLVMGTHEFVWSVSNGAGCNVVHDTVQVNILDTLFATAGPDISLCNQYSTILSADTLPNGTNGIWLYGGSVPSTPIFSNATVSNPTVSNLREGTYPFYWRVSNGLCTDEYDTLMVEVYDLPSSSAGLDQDLCGQYSTILSGNTLTGRAKGKWRFVSSTNSSIPTILNDTSSITTISSLNEGSYTITWTVSSGSCADAVDTIIINVYDPPIADAGYDTILCSEDSLRLFANNPSGTATGLWTLDPFSSMTPLPTLKSPSAHNSDIINLTIGASQQVIWTVSNGTCPQDVDTMLISVLSRPTVEAGNDTSYCGVYTINLNAFPISQPATGSWSVDPTSSPSTPIFSNKSNPNTSVSGLIEGTYKFIWRGLNLPCYDISDTVEVTIFDQHTAFVGADIYLCDKPSVVINGNAVSGTANSRWYLASSTPNVPTFNASQANTNLGGLVAGGTYNMVWEITNGVCPVSRDTLRVFNQFVPDASFIQDATEICQNDQVTFTSTSTMTLPETIATEVWEVNGGLFSGPSHSEIFSNPGYYDITLYVVASNGCMDTSFLKDAVFVHTNPIASFSATTNPEDDYKMQVHISDMAQFATNYTYKFGDGNASNMMNPIHQYKDSGYFTIWQIVTNDFGCTDSISKIVYMQQTMAYIPNAFSPNNDGTNDIFIPVISGNDESKYRFVVLNRWGEEVFVSTSSNEGWDGSYKGIQSPVGTYVWKLIYKEKNGTESITKIGHVNLVR